MDFSKFDSRKNGETARPLHLRNPATGDLLWDVVPKNTHDDSDGVPCLAWVYGSESDTVQREAKRIRMERLEDGKKANRKDRRASKATGIPLEDDRGMGEFHDDQAEIAIAKISHFENVSVGGRDLTNTDEDKLLLLRMQVMNLRDADGQKSFLEQVNEFSNDRREWLGND